MSKRISWDDYFFEIAEVVSKRSTCLRRKYGAVIVKNNKILSTGYNGAPVDEENCCDRGYCEREAKNIPSGERYELCRSVHAEANAIINGNPADMIGATIYIAGTNVKDSTPASCKPCMMCARMIKNAKIEYVKERN